MKYKTILAQIETLQKKAETARKSELSKVIADIKAQMEAHGVTIDDLRESTTRRGKKKAVKKTARKAAKKTAKKVAAKRKKVAAKYRDPASGAEWTGRGRQPRWLAEATAKGAKLESFLIKR